LPTIKSTNSGIDFDLRPANVDKLKKTCEARN